MGIALGAHINVVFEGMWRAIHTREEALSADKNLFNLISISLSQVLIGLHLFVGRIGVVNVNTLNTSSHHTPSLELIRLVIDSQKSRVEDVFALVVQELVVGRTDRDAARTAD